MRLCLALVAMAAVAPSAAAQSGLLNRSRADFFSHDGNIAFLVGGVAAGRSPVARRETLTALLASSVAADGLKRLTRERRPDGTDRLSFPSGHATAAFAIAECAARADRRTAPLWYLGAALIADSRVALRRHYPHDVLAGAVLGIVVARQNWRF